MSENTKKAPSVPSRSLRVYKDDTVRPTVSLLCSKIFNCSWSSLPSAGTSTAIKNKCDDRADNLMTMLQTWDWHAVERHVYRSTDVSSALFITIWTTGGGSIGRLSTEQSYRKFSFNMHMIQASISVPLSPMPHILECTGCCLIISLKGLQVC